MEKRSNPFLLHPTLPFTPKNAQTFQPNSSHMHLYSIITSFAARSLPWWRRPNLARHLLCSLSPQLLQSLIPLIFHHSPLLEICDLSPQNTLACIQPKTSCSSTPPSPARTSLPTTLPLLFQHQIDIPNYSHNSAQKPCVPRHMPWPPYSSRQYYR